MEKSYLDLNKKPSSGKILSLAINDRDALYASYMPFVSNGGLFIPTQRQYAIGDEILITLTLLNEPDKLPVAGRVVWITPRGAQSDHPAGIGVQISDQDGGRVRNKIETYLAGMLKSERPTHTM